MTTHLKQNSLLPSSADFFQAAQTGLTNICQQVGELGLSEVQLLLLLASKRLGAWVPLLQVKAEMPGRSNVKISRILSKLEHSDQLLITRPTRASKREKELRLTSQGLKVAKQFAKPFTVTPEKPKALSDNAIPPTSKQHYLTGKTALNIPSKSGTGDWHFFEVFQGTHGRAPGPFFIAGKELIDTTELLADEGVTECSNILKNHGATVTQPVYAADHARAMTDMLYSAIKKDQRFEESYNLDDWFPAIEDKKELFHLVKKLRSGMSSQQWSRLDRWIGQWRRSL